MMGKFIDMTGWKMWEHGVPDSRITVIEKVEPPEHVKTRNIAYWLCECNCEKYTRFIASGNSVRQGNTKSCGCINSERSSRMCIEKNVHKYHNTFVEFEDFYKVYDRFDNMFIIDKDDKEKIEKYYWEKYRDENYFKASVNGKKVWLHRFLIDAKKREYVDHKNNQFEDYRKENLRICTNAENNRNVGLKKNNSSGYTGVEWFSLRQKWRARITVDGNDIHLGLFDHIEDAIKARKEAEKKYFGSFSYDNSQKNSTFILCNGGNT